VQTAYSQAAAELGYAHYGAHREGCHRRHQAWRRRGQESGQQLYTMRTRGRTVNHIGSLVEDGDPHAAIWSDTLRPRTATGLREQVLARDATPQSATTLRRDEQDSPSGSAPPPASWTPSTSLPNTSPTRSWLPVWTRAATCCSTDLAGRPCAAICSFGPRRRDPVAELLTAAALPPVVHQQVRRSRDLRARIIDGPCQLQPARP
jgi:hypothetical protein